MASASRRSTPFGSVLVIGGCGFFGHHLVRTLRDQHLAWPISVFSRKPDVNLLSEVDYYPGDITDADTMKELLGKIQPCLIFHAASPDPFTDPPNPNAYVQVNVDGTANVLAHAKASPSVAALVYTSSLTVVLYDKNGECFDADEDAPIYRGPVTQKEPYHTSKGMADVMVRAAANTHLPHENGLRTGCIRVPGIYGEGDENMIVPGLQLAQWGLGCVQFGNNTTGFEPVYVANAVHGHVLLAKALLEEASNGPSSQPAEDQVTTKRINGESFNITDDHPAPFWDYMRAIYAAAGHPQNPHEIWVIPAWLVHVLAVITEWAFWVIYRGQRRPKVMSWMKLEFVVVNRTYSTKKAKQRLHWHAIVPRAEAARRSADWGLKWIEGHKNGQEKLD
ncbi:Sterol-4-alpha-carboxylic decarboxylase [Lachnellula arida]|uniref:Sterol-4-alpha-carboxylic decarboxylase n=1 Tax=Lachnellula arida TaxID=1316785 RepID=A0A8T9BPK4_9HELO|nr:Sterol-4-alpha-carboxylic decarboxylase [Lachnellula arida]